MSELLILSMIFSICLFFLANKKKVNSNSKSEDILNVKIKQLELSLETSLTENKNLAAHKMRLLKDLESQLEKYNALLSDYNKLTCDLNTYIEHRNDDLKNIFSNCDHAFSYVATLYADYLLVDYENASKYLLNKKRPATS